MRNSFVTGIKPELSLYGSGGTYFLNDAYKWNLLVFKPEDEEPFAENNPRRPRPPPSPPRQSSGRDGPSRLPKGDSLRRGLEARSGRLHAGP